MTPATLRPTRADSISARIDASAEMVAQVGLTDIVAPPRPANNGSDSSGV